MLAGFQFPDIVITAAAQAGPFSATDPMFGPSEVKSNFCRVSGTIAPAIKFQVWQPPQDRWDGKLEGVGNGRGAGSVAKSGLVSAAAEADGGATLSRRL
ncbi:MAG: hypothetical protein JWM91_74 [Rhodospirillales bacterium]|nr:hypothetical protein [Rhodospirillales bacterium]